VCCLTSLKDQKNSTQQFNMRVFKTFPVMTANKRSRQRRGIASAKASADLATGHPLRPAHTKMSDKLVQPQNRWQRSVRYTWDKNRGRG
jgi:hypothetical protein